jgi:hypothetical protein
MIAKAAAPIGVLQQVLRGVSIKYDISVLCPKFAHRFFRAISSAGASRIFAECSSSVRRRFGQTYCPVGVAGLNCRPGAGGTPNLLAVYSPGTAPSQTNRFQKSVGQRGSTHQTSSVDAHCRLGVALFCAQHKTERKRLSYHVGVKPHVSFARHDHRAVRRPRASARGSRSTQDRRSAVCGRLRNLPSQPPRPRQGQVQLGTVGLPAPALHEQRCLGAEAHSLS